MLDTDRQPMTGSTPPLILFATPPALDSLQALTVWIMTSTKHPARFQPQVIKCREFIFTEPDIIGSPSTDIRNKCFHLIAQLSLLKSGKLQNRLSRVGLEVSKPHPVTPELYQSCLRYTLQARISPGWNRAGQWLIQGRDFLTQRGCANAVRLDLTVTHNELYFTLQASALRLAPLQVTDLDIVGNSLKEFQDNTRTQIDHDRIASDWCFVLPSMKKGRIVSISHELPENSPFMSYRDLKRHWKNTYGYRLPETEENMNFYQIHFGPLGGRLFTYPEVCLRIRELQQVSRVDPKPILRAFLMELNDKVPTICGVPMKLQSKAKFPVAHLWLSGQTEPTSQPNLTNRMTKSRSSIYRSRSAMDCLLSHSQPNPPRDTVIEHTMHTVAGVSNIQQVEASSKPISATVGTSGTTGSLPIASNQLRKPSTTGNIKATTPIPYTTVTHGNKSKNITNQSEKQDKKLSLDGKQIGRETSLSCKSSDTSIAVSSQWNSPDRLTNGGVSSAVSSALSSQAFKPTRSNQGDAPTVGRTMTYSHAMSRSIVHSQSTDVPEGVGLIQSPVSSQTSQSGQSVGQSNMWTPSHNRVNTNHSSVSRKLFPQFTAKKCFGVAPKCQETDKGRKIIPIFNQQRKPCVTEIARTSTGSSAGSIAKSITYGTAQHKDASGLCQRNPNPVVPLFHKMFPQKSVDSVSCLKGMTLAGKKLPEISQGKQAGKIHKEKKAQKRPRTNKGDDRKATKKKLMMAES